MSNITSDKVSTFVINRSQDLLDKLDNDKLGTHELKANTSIMNTMLKAVMTEIKYKNANKKK